MTRKTGILGGTFDPVHNGHLALAQAAGNLCDLSEVMLLPAAVPPHKQGQNVSDFSHRAEMLAIASQGNSLLHVSTLENMLSSPSYTIDTLMYLELHSVGEVEFYFIIGADAFLDLPSWYKYTEVLNCSHFIVFSRKGYKSKKLHRIFKRLNYSRKKDHWKNTQSGKSIYTSDISLPVISSSKIRRRIAAGLSVRELLPDGVDRYIRKHGLYQC